MQKRYQTNIYFNDTGLTFNELMSRLLVSFLEQDIISYLEGDKINGEWNL